MALWDVATLVAIVVTQTSFRHVVQSAQDPRTESGKNNI